ncbi:MAG: protein-L-isoaspartate(D-aspartate) O-methyltransferase [Acidobacteria bacterium]|nr:protein-L-isoaspartate(D-aspartate) O-methyltransferase [Acidobacteriota bacterium]MCA1649275.1 protein-L-isoaspartate(D-aspartate) O-methyltransferase [Acidobacteriota bacterium]
MVATQITARGMRDPGVSEAMQRVERHLFVPPDQRPHAYEDRPLPIGDGQTISQPYMVAVMTEALAPAADSLVLEIGTGSGYQSAVLAVLAAHVISIERHATLATRATANLEAAGVTNVEVLVGDGTEGYAPRAPYDRILVTAGAPAVPETLTSQLADGGRLVIPVGPHGLQRVTIIERRGGNVSRKEGESCVFVPLVGRHGWAPDA